MYTRYVLRNGDVGIAVNKMQGYLNIFHEHQIIKSVLVLDGRFGYRTSVAVQEFQNYAKMTMDGIIGSNTWDRIISELATLGVVTNIPVFSSSYYLTIGSTGIEVFKMQEYLNEIAANNTCLKPIRVDGAYGNEMSTMVRQYQYLKNISIDGAIGKSTWDSIVNEYIKL